MADDCLNLWNYYTKSSKHVGFSLKINTQDLINNSLNNSGYSYTNGKVIYSEEHQKSLLEDILKQYNLSYVESNNKQGFNEKIFFRELKKLLDIYNLFFKPKAYEIEQEYRFVIIDMNMINKKVIDKKFRIFNDIFIPYVELSDMRKLIKEIKISPTHNQELLENSIFILKNNYGLQNVKISKSKIPMRY